VTNTPGSPTEIGTANVLSNSTKIDLTNTAVVLLANLLHITI